MSARRMYFHNKKKDESAILSVVKYSHRLLNLRLRSNIDQQVEVNFGDGTIETYNLTANSNFSVPSYNYPDSQERVLTISFEKRFNVVTIDFERSQIKGVMDQNITLFKNLNRFGGRACKITSLPDSFYDLEFIEEINFDDFFDDSYNEIPNQIFNKPISKLIFAQSGWKENNCAGIEKIYQLASTLGTLSFPNGCNAADIPNSFANLINLGTLGINADSNFDVPPIINQITSLTTYQSRDCNISSFSNFTNLINLKTLDLINNPNISTDFSLMNGVQNLSNLYVNGSYRTQQRIDDFIDSFYAVVDANGDKTGSNSMPFRGINLLVHGATTPKPSGIYQQPSGFILGTSNGTPASQLEKIWVLVNQYNHSITYTL